MQDEFAGRVVGDGENMTTVLEEELTATNVKRHYDIVYGQGLGDYCWRRMHRGNNRSRVWVG